MPNDIFLVVRHHIALSTLNLIMEDASWEQKVQTLTHILTSPTTAPTLHSQFFVSTQIPCYLNWDYPPVLCAKPNSDTFPSLHLRWGFSLFLKRVSRLGLPETSWRCKCPYQQPPPLILAKGVDGTQWDDVQRKEYARRRLRRKRLIRNVHPAIPVLVPNLIAIVLLFYFPTPPVD